MLLVARMRVIAKRKDLKNEATEKCEHKVKWSKV